MLRAVGAQVDTPESGGEPNVWRVTPGALLGRDLTVEPDLSNAQPFLAAALVTGGRVAIPDWPARTTQPGDALREIFTEMGGSCELTERGPDLHRLGPDPRHRRGPGRGRRADPGHRGGRGPGRLPVHAARRRPPAAARDGPAGRAHQGDQRARRRRHRDRRRPAHPPAPAARRGLPHLRRPPHGHRRRDHRPGGRGRADRERGDDGQDPAGLPRAVDRDARGTDGRT